MALPKLGRALKAVTVGAGKTLEESFSSAIGNITRPVSMFSPDLIASNAVENLLPNSFVRNVSKIYNSEKLKEDYEEQQRQRGGRGGRGDLTNVERELNLITHQMGEANENTKALLQISEAMDHTLQSIASDIVSIRGMTERVVDILADQFQQTPEQKVANDDLIPTLERMGLEDNFKLFNLKNDNDNEVKENEKPLGELQLEENKSVSITDDSDEEEGKEKKKGASGLLEGLMGGMTAMIGPEILTAIVGFLPELIATAAAGIEIWRHWDDIKSTIGKVSSLIESAKSWMGLGGNKSSPNEPTPTEPENQNSSTSNNIVVQSLQQGFKNAFNQLTDPIGSTINEVKSVAHSISSLTSGSNNIFSVNTAPQPSISNDDFAKRNQSLAGISPNANNVTAPPNDPDFAKKLQGLVGKPPETVPSAVPPPPLNNSNNQNNDALNSAKLGDYIQKQTVSQAQMLSVLTGLAGGAPQSASIQTPPITSGARITESGIIERNQQMQPPVINNPPAAPSLPPSAYVEGGSAVQQPPPSTSYSTPADRRLLGR